MSTIERTAYPRYLKRKKIKQKDLDKFYTMTLDETNLMQKEARHNHSRLSLAIQLKSFQNLGYFEPISEIPEEIIIHIKRTSKFHHKLNYGYDESSPTTMYTHRSAIREYLNITRWSKSDIEGRCIHSARKAAIKFAYDTSHNMNNIPDIINAVIQFLVEHNYELPSFHTLNQLVRHTRHAVNNKIFNMVMDKMSNYTGPSNFIRLLTVDDG